MHLKWTHKGFDMWGYHWNPADRWMAFGNAYVDINATINVSRKCDSQNSDKIVYTAVTKYHGYDQYQWTTNGPWAKGLCGIIGYPGKLLHLGNTTWSWGKDFHTYWDWTEPTVQGEVLINASSVPTTQPTTK